MQYWGYCSNSLSEGCLSLVAKYANATGLPKRREYYKASDLPHILETETWKLIFDGVSQILTYCKVEYRYRIKLHI